MTTINCDRIKLLYYVFCGVNDIGKSYVRDKGMLNIWKEYNFIIICMNRKEQNIIKQILEDIKGAD